MTNISDKDGPNMNRDPISGAPGAHPIGTGLGAAGGAAAGATIGAIGGPVGMAVGGAVGAVVGGLGGSAAGEAVNPTAEYEYWRTTYATEPYVKQDFSYDDYAPAYKLGYANRSMYPGQTFDQASDALAGDWETNKGTSRLDWGDARQATRAAWHRVERAMPGDADGDGI